MKRLAVFRPDNSMLALEIARSLAGKSGAEADAAFQKILDSQTYRFAGWPENLKLNRRLLDSNGVYVGEILPGDSFVEVEESQA